MRGSDRVAASVACFLGRAVTAIFVAVGFAGMAATTAMVRRFGFKVGAIVA